MLTATAILLMVAFVSLILMTVSYFKARQSKDENKHVWHERVTHFSFVTNALCVMSFITMM